MLQYETEIRASYLHATLWGAFTLISAKDVTRAVVERAAAIDQPRILMDCTRITGEMTMQDRLEFGAYLAELQQQLFARLAPGPQIAILAVPPIMDPGRFTQTVANNRGVRMRASESLQELLSWLGV